MQESGQRENTWLRTIGAALPVLLLLLTMPAMSWYGDRLKDRAHEQQLAGDEALAAAQELKALTAELAAWQLASTLDLERGTNEALPDGGFNRRQFQSTARSLQQRLEQLQASTETAAADLADLQLFGRQLDELMRLDRNAMQALTSADPSQAREPPGTVLRMPGMLMDSLIGAVGQMVSLRALRARDLARAAESAAQLGRQLQIGALALALALGTLFLTMLRRWIRLSQAYLVQLGRLTMRDEVSGALNRRAWTLRAGEAFAQAARMGYPLAACIVDIDRFGRFNTNYGRTAGDDLLMELARRMKGHLRAQDLLARLDGGRFVLLLVDCNPTGAGAKLRDLRADMPPLQTFSAGFACWNGAESPDELLARTGQALEEAKLQGSNCIVSAPLAECVGQDAYRHWLQPVAPSSD